MNRTSVCHPFYDYVLLSHMYLYTLHLPGQRAVVSPMPNERESTTDGKFGNWSFRQCVTSPTMSLPSGVNMWLNSMTMMTLSWKQLHRVSRSTFTLARFQPEYTVNLQFICIEKWPFSSNNCHYLLHLVYQKL